MGMVDGPGWPFEFRRGGRYGEEDESGKGLLKSSAFSLDRKICGENGKT